MAKSWKNFVKKEDPSLNPGGPQGLSGAEKELDLSLEEHAKSNEQLRAILDHRRELEEKMRRLTNPSAAQNQQGLRFESTIDPIGRKRREDGELFTAKQKLEEKLRLKKEELNAWTKKVKRTREKVKRAKEQFDRKMEELRRSKKKVDEFAEKLRSKPSDGFDYEKPNGPLKKAFDDFPFTERMENRIDEVFNKPVAQVKEKITERVPAKKIVDTWEGIKDKKKEAAKLKAKFEAAMDKKDGLFEFDGFPSKLKESFDDDAEEDVEPDDDQPAEKKTGEEKKKQSLLDRWKERRKAKKAGEKEKRKKTKPKDMLPGDLDLPLERDRGEEGPGKEKEQDNEEQQSLERREERRKRKREERVAERKAARKKKRFGEETFESENDPDSAPADDAGEPDESAEQRKSESIEQRRKEKDESERNESRKQEKLRDRIAQRREARREEERHEKRKKVKDKFD